MSYESMLVTKPFDLQSPVKIIVPTELAYA
jgi:hypothetical protein